MTRFSVFINGDFTLYRLDLSKTQHNRELVSVSAIFQLSGLDSFDQHWKPVQFQPSSSQQLKMKICILSLNFVLVALLVIQIQSNLEIEIEGNILLFDSLSWTLREQYCFLKNLRNSKTQSSTTLHLMRNSTTQSSTTLHLMRNSTTLLPKSQ